MPHANALLGAAWASLAIRRHQVISALAWVLFASISQAAGGGLKSFFLKAVDPLFRKPGAGTELPFRIRGHRSEPKFGLDVGKALSSR